MVCPPLLGVVVAEVNASDFFSGDEDAMSRPPPQDF